MKILIEISDQRIKDALITALEGGSNYWYFVNFDKGNIPLKVDCAMSEHIVNSVMDGHYVAIEDIETGENLGVLSHSSIEKGLQLLSKDYPSIAASITDHLDASESDILLQLCVMGEVVFG